MSSVVMDCHGELRLLSSCKHFMCSSTAVPGAAQLDRSSGEQVATAKDLAEDEAGRLRGLLAVTGATEAVPERGLHLLKVYEQRLASAQHRLAMQVSWPYVGKAGGYAQKSCCSPMHAMTVLLNNSGNS